MKRQARRRGGGSLEHAELLTRTSNLSDDVRLVKTHQWQATYLSLTLSGAMVALLKLDPSTSSLVAVVSIVQAALLVAFHISFARNLFKYRTSGYRMNEQLNKITHLYEKIAEFPSECWKFWRGALSILYAIGLAGIALAGATLTLGYSAPTSIQFIARLIRSICGRPGA